MTGIKKCLIIINLIVVISVNGQGIDYEIVIRPAATNFMKYGSDKETINALGSTNPGGVLDIGMIVSKKFDEKKKIGMGLMYSQFGSNYVSLASDLEYKEKYRMKYISVPMQLTINMKENKELQLGLSHNILFKTKYRFFDRSGVSNPSDTTIIEYFSDLKVSEIRIYNLSIDIAYSWKIVVSEKTVFKIGPFLDFMIFDSYKGSSGIKHLNYKFGIDLRLNFNKS